MELAFIFAPIVAGLAAIGGGSAATGALLAGSTALGAIGAYGSIKAGQAQQKAAQLDAQAQLERAKAKELQIKYVDIQADQTAAARRDELKKALSDIRAIRAARGGMASAGGAIEADVSRRARRGEQIDLLGFSADKNAIRNEIASLRQGSAASLQTGKAAALSGWAGAAGNLIGAANSASRIWGNLFGGPNG